MKQSDLGDAPDHMEMPCVCEECSKWFDLNDGSRHPKKEIVICEQCADRIEAEVEREDEIQDLLTQLSDAEYTVKSCREQLVELGHKFE